MSACPGRTKRRGRAWRLVRGTAGDAARLAAAAGGFVLLNVACIAYVEMPPAAACAWLLAMGAALLWAARRSGARRRATLRLRPLAASTCLRVVACAPACLALQLAAVVLLARTGLAGALREPAPGALARYAAQPGGWAPGLLYAVALAPLLEEVCFRGAIQRPLERRVGRAPAIAATAGLFAWMHGHGAAGLANVLFAGMAGYAVAATGSLWSGVALHAANNALAELLPRLPEAWLLRADAALHLSSTPGLVLCAGACAAVLAWNGARLHRGGRRLEAGARREGPPPAAAVRPPNSAARRTGSPARREAMAAPGAHHYT